MACLLNKLINQISIAIKVNQLWFYRLTLLNHLIPHQFIIQILDLQLLLVQHFPNIRKYQTQILNEIRLYYILPQPQHKPHYHLKRFFQWQVLKIFKVKLNVLIIRRLALQLIKKLRRPLLNLVHPVILYIIWNPQYTQNNIL